MALFNVTDSISMKICSSKLYFKHYFADKIARACEQVQLPDGKLIKEEEREKGKISKQVYLTYMRACTLALSLLVIFLIVITQAMKMGTDFWLSAWSESSVDEDKL
ncbi:Multidrug resistance-associated protein 7, partial [Stegodyphus mimosarum]